MYIYNQFLNGQIDNYHIYIDNVEATDIRWDGTKYYKVYFDSTPLVQSDRFYDFVIKDSEGNICNQCLKLCVFSYFRTMLRGGGTAAETAKAFIAMYNAYNQFIGK